MEREENAANLSALFIPDPPEMAEDSITNKSMRGIPGQEMGRDPLINDTEIYENTNRGRFRANQGTIDQATYI